MRVGTVIVDGARRAAVLEGDRVRVTALPGLDAAIAAGVDLSLEPGERVPLADVVLDAPLRPGVVYCLGLNYGAHLQEQGKPAPKEPEFFLKAGTTIAAPGEPLVLRPEVTRKLDAETELGVVLGRAGEVYGYVVVNDVTARDRQVVPHPHGGFTMALGPGKNFDGATRVSAWVTTADEVPDPQALGLRQRVNGELTQSSTTAHMLHPVASLLAYVGTLLTLPPGSLLATGTPAGTGWGQDPEIGGSGLVPDGCVPARYLRAGDVVESELDGLEPLRFAVVAP